VPEPLEPPGQDVEQKATQEFYRLQRQSALPIASLVILPAEGHCAILAGEEPSSADGYPMRVRAKVSPKPWDWRSLHEIGCCFPVGENLWCKSHLTNA
jgi:hypothetical protein